MLPALISHLRKDVGKDLSSAGVTYAGSVCVHVHENLGVVRELMSMKVVKTELQTLVAGPEVSTQQMTWIHVTSRNAHIMSDIYTVNQNYVLVYV